jgi:hypothetical protein
VNPTIAVAILSSPGRAGRAIAPQERPVLGAPLHLSLHTSPEAAVRALDAAMREEWNERYASHLGPAEDWQRDRLSRRMVEDGYLAAVVEREVALDDDRDLPFGRLYAAPPAP